MSKSKIKPSVINLQYCSDERSVKKKYTGYHHLKEIHQEKDSKGDRTAE